MKTLKEAVDELASISEPKKHLLDLFGNGPTPNSMQRRCLTCPVAQFLTSRVLARVWTSARGFAYLTDVDGLPLDETAVRLPSRIKFLIEELDKEAWRSI